ncbi:MAG: aminoacyl-histidine dipeptidase [Muribaculaceae bacterium]|nr:aminoacyl-histidine dipeptidase [Muribaculaceae bacterium]
MTIKELKPTRVWEIFHEITQVPRPSGNLDKIRAWLVDFAKRNNLQYKVDQVGNVAMFRPAAPGFENAKKVVLQGHMDMVAEKTSDSNHDFNNDPIQTIIDGEWVRANNTTLGADDGLGLAIALAAITDPDIKCGALEALATVDEETGLTGASNITPEMLQGDYLLNLDSEDDGVITIGCAGGLVSIATFQYKELPAPKDLNYFELSLLSLHGGHSGTDINCGYASATKLIARLLWTIRQEIPYELACIDSGNLHNAISRDAKAVIGIQPADKEKLAVVFNRFVAEIENEYRHTEKNMKCACTGVDSPATIIDADTAQRMVAAVFAAPHGVYSMSLEMEGLVETSTNLASVKMRPGCKIVIEGFHRSAVESRKIELTNQMETIFRLAGATVTNEGGYQGWEPNTNSRILNIAVDCWEKLYGVKPTVEAIHAGLECGLFLKVCPHMDMISYGPTLKDVHSPQERCHIPAVQKGWDFTVAILNAVAKE